MIVPCHDEAAVIERRLANLVRCAWPEGPNVVVVVDDHSGDDTADRARAFVREHANAAVTVEVVESDRRPGKTSAIAAGLAAIEERAPDVRPDLVGITDADVVLAPDALVRIAKAFDDVRLGLACGSQRFVASLGGDGAPPPPDADDAGGRYDHITAVIRRLESRAGRLFSVHGQLAVWRRELGVAPTIGVAADDVDLMARVRTAGWRTACVDGATFYETKPVRVDDRAVQARRRAYAWFDALDVARERARAEGRATPLGSSFGDRVQWAAYATLPLACARYGLAFAVVAVAVLASAAYAAFGGGAAFVAIGVVVLALFAWAGLGPLRDWVRLARVIRRARAERAAELAAGSTPQRSGGDRWQMSRR